MEDGHSLTIWERFENHRFGRVNSSYLCAVVLMSVHCLVGKKEGKGGSEPARRQGGKEGGEGGEGRKEGREAGRERRKKEGE